MKQKVDTMALLESIQQNVALRSFTTFGIEAKARYYLALSEVHQLTQLRQSPEWADLSAKAPVLVLGGGSNLILTDDFPGLVLHMALKGKEQVDEDDQHVYISAKAGENWHEFVQWTLTLGLGGLENLSLIPGSVGAAPIQNIGAYGVELKDYFYSLSWYEWASGKVHVLTNADCQFAYRDSVFKRELKDKGVILDATFALPKRWQATLQYGDIKTSLAATGIDLDSVTPHQLSQTICAIRQSKLPDPKQLGNAGSFYKNPLVSEKVYLELLQRHPLLVSYPQADGQHKLAAGWLIENAGWKGRSLGQAAVYEKQALVLVNLGGATGREVMTLANKIQADVFKEFGVALEIEPVVV